MFGVGYQEMFIILVAALVIFGPQRLPELAGQVGKWVRQFRQMSSDLTGEFDKTFAEVDEVRQAVRRELSGIKDEVEGVSASVKKDLGGVKGGKGLGKAGGAKSATAARAGGSKGAGTKGLPGAKVVTNGRTKELVLPAATKTDPLSDVSFMDDVAAKPVRLGIANGATANGHATEAEADDALARVRRRRSAAGYARRA